MIYLSEHADKKLIQFLKKLDEIEYIRENNRVYKEVSSHPDLYMCDLGDTVFHGDSNKLGFRYPENCIYNAACTGRFFIHNLKITSPALLREAQNRGMIQIHVSQGYSKCNIVVVDADSIITSDRGICQKCREHMNVLLVSESTKENPIIGLEGFPYGFLGGASGRINDTIIFNGNIRVHPDYDRILEFITARGLKIKDFDYPLADIGSIIYE